MALLSPAPDQVGTDSGATHLVRRLWALAALSHLVGNPTYTALLPSPSAAGLAAAGVAIAAFAVLGRPAQRASWHALAGFAVALAWFELPRLPSHWALGSLVSVAVLGSAATRNPTEWFERTARLLLVGFYVFAAFAKLNSGFLDPAVSCAVFYTNQTLAAFKLPGISPAGPLALPVALGTVAIELSVPLLLARRRTRTAGAVLGMGFHLGISFDLSQHFYDFTAVLLPLFMLFLPPTTRALVADRLRLGPRIQRALGGATVVVVLCTMVQIGPLAVLGRVGAFVLWLPFCVWFGWGVAGAVRADRAATRQGAVVSFRPAGIGAALLVLVTLLNGAAPYLELKTASAFNMYANLVTENGESNHLIVRRTLPLTDGNANPIEVIATEDPGLSEYVRTGFRPTEDRFFHYLAEHPDITVTYRQSGVEHTVTGADAGTRMSLIAYKLVAFRALAPEGPPACQLLWYAAL